MNNKIKGKDADFGSKDEFLKIKTYSNYNNFYEKRMKLNHNKFQLNKILTPTTKLP
jgi:hypothetical protein